MSLIFYGQHAHLCFIGLSLALSSQTTRHGINLALAAWHAIKDVNIEVLLDDIPDLVVLALLQVPLEQLVRVPGDAQNKLAGAKVEQSLVASHVLLLCQTRQHLEVISVITLLIPAKPEMEWHNFSEMASKQRKTILSRKLTFQRTPWPHSHGCCTLVPGTCEQTVGRKPGTVLLDDSPKQFL